MDNAKVKRILFLALGYIIIVSAYHIYLKSYSKDQAVHRIEQLLLSTKAHRKFVAREQKVAVYDLKEEGKLSYDYFHKALLSSSYIMRVASEYYNKELKQNGLREILFRQPSINPLNPDNKANALEAELIGRFNKGELKEYYEIKKINGKEVLYYIKPFAKVNPSCMQCHGDPKDAPRDLLREYGTASGFGYKIGEINSAISIATSLEGDREEANKYLLILSFTTLALFIVAYILIEKMVSHIKQAKSIKEYSDELEEKVEERTKELKDSLELVQNSQNRLIQTEKMASLGGLVAGVSHEINTPIGVSVTAASHLEKKYEEFLQLYNDNQVTQEDFDTFMSTNQRSLEIILHNLQRAAQLISSFKSIAVDQSSNDIRQVNLKEYLNSIVLSLHPKLKITKHKVIIICDDMIINIAAGALAQIITNLIDNALIHAFEGIEYGEITIEVTQDSDSITIKYSDNGNGMDEETSKKYFEPFYTTKRSSGGSGLGAHLIYNLVTQTLGGEISLQTQENEGLIVTIKIPSEGENHV